MAVYNISKTCFKNINRFYSNVAKKYCHAYNIELMRKNIREAIDSMYKIENGLLRRTPTIKRWKGKGFMANTKKWYFLYKMVDDTISYRRNTCPKYA